MARKIVATYTTEIPDPTKTFETSSKDLVIGLLSLGHRPLQVESEGRIIYYKFDKSAVAKDVNRILTSDDILISFHKSIAANSVWAMNLTRANELASA